VDWVIGNTTGGGSSEVEVRCAPVTGSASFEVDGRLVGGVSKVAGCGSFESRVDGLLLGSLQAGVASVLSDVRDATFCEGKVVLSSGNGNPDTSGDVEERSRGAAGGANAVPELNGSVADMPLKPPTGVLALFNN